MKRRFDKARAYHRRMCRRKPHWNVPEVLYWCVRVGPLEWRVWDHEEVRMR